MIPKNIKRDHILKVIKEIDRSSIPKNRQSKKFQLDYNGTFYPPKYVIALANKYANGIELSPTEFSGGQESNSFLIRLGFIIEGSQNNNLNILIKEGEKYRHIERCCECKNIIIEMFRKIYGTVKVDYKIKISARIEEYVGKPYYDNLKKILMELESYRGNKDFIRCKTLPRCDLYIPNPGFVVKLDESQHFTLARKLSLSCYPEKLSLRFNIIRWKELCERINAKDNYPLYRDEQRAWYDTLRDFLPLIKDLKPTIRLFMKDYQWCILNPDKPSDVEKFRSLIAIKKKPVSENSLMRFILCVPAYNNQWDAVREKYETGVAKYARKHDADLVIFPERYLMNCKYENAVNEVKKIAKRMETAVLVGVSTEEGYQLAVFWNPKHKTGETSEHIYIKHSSANTLAYESPGYKGKDDPMFNPIILSGRKIGVMICHDMFFPLVTHNLVKRGAEILIDLTGENVILQKWNNIIQARSLEIKGTFICTMSHNLDKKSGGSSCIVYERGRKVPFLDDKEEERFEGPKQPRSPGYSAMVTVPCRSSVSNNNEQRFSNKNNYSDIIISFKNGTKADLNIIKNNDEIKCLSCGKVLHPDADGWIRTKKKGTGTIGLIIFSLEDIKDRTLILKRRPKSHVDFHFVLYSGKKSKCLTNHDLMALARLRAIENRIGILILTDGLCEVIKTNNYKNIQRFEAQNDLFGINKECLGGPESIFTKGISKEFKDEYFKLL